MASGTSGAEDLHRDKPKWGENIIVYTRKIHVNSNKNDVTNSKNDIETSEKTAVDSCGGNKNIVGGGTSTENNGEKNCENVNVAGESHCESVIEEVPDKENSVKEGPTVTGDNVEKNCEGVVEEVPSNAEETAAATDSARIENEVPAKTVDDEKIIEEVPRNVSSVKEVLDVVDKEKETLCAENKIEEVTATEHNKQVSADMISTEQIPDIEHNIEAQKRMTNVEATLHNERNVLVGPQYEKNIEEVPDEDVEIRESFSPKLPVEEAKFPQARHIPSNVETLTVSDDSSSHGLVEAPQPNGHERMENRAIREERAMLSQVDDRLIINVMAAKSKDEVRDLKRKLESKLDQVRKMARKLQAKENQLSSTDFGSGRLREETPAVGRLRFPANGGSGNNVSTMTGNENSGYVGYNTPRPFIQRSSSMTNSSYHGARENVHEKEKRTPRANQLYQNSDFLLGKDKFPPASSNKKAKSSGGSRKHGGGDLSSGFGFDKKFHKKCSDLLQKLRNHKHGWVFNVPVDVKRLGLHDYFDIIKHPMDLGTVKTRLTNNWYKTPREFAEDVRLTFHNAMTYNPEGQDVHIMAKDLLRIFEDKWPSIEADYDRKLRYEMFRDVGTPTPTSRKLYAPAHHPIHMPLPQPPLLHLPPSFQEARNYERSQSMPARPASRPKPTPSVVRTPAPKKPKAREPNKRDMTYEEKQKLSTNLQCLPSDKLDAIAQIIKKRESAFSQHDDEIEVDIDKVDAETLWELDRFVTNYKKRLSKHKRKAEIAMQARAQQAMQAGASAAEAVQETAPQAPQAPLVPPAQPAPANVEAPREHRTDEENIGASSHVQQEKQSGNDSDSSSTSSSSSDSGSSSSDSDSDSSSDSDSDEDR